jgi:hypothetical protein
MQTAIPPRFLPRAPRERHIVYLVVRPCVGTSDPTVVMGGKVVGGGNHRVPTLWNWPICASTNLSYKQSWLCCVGPRGLQGKHNTRNGPSKEESAFGMYSICPHIGGYQQISQPFDNQETRNLPSTRAQPEQNKAIRRCGRDIVPASYSW